jgi:uncharacterized protein (DUF58 family)
MWFRNIFRADPASPPASPAPPAPLAISPAAYRQLDRLRIRASRYLLGASLGRRGSQLRRPASDFREHRKYVPGDDIRFVDWKASARSEHIYLKQGELPQETTVHILLDTSASMAWGDPSKRDFALQLAAALGYLALANEDRLQLTLLGPRPAAPQRIKGKANFPQLMKILPEIRFGGQIDLAERLRDFSKSQRGGVVLLLSDLLDVDDLPRALAVLPRPHWEVSLLHTLHPEELDPSIDGEYEIVDAERGDHVNYDINTQARAHYHEHLDAWRRAVELACIDHYVLYTLLSTGWSLEGETLPHLRRLNVLEPL